MLELVLPAFLVSVVLLGIHSYFGLEIIKRGIIFTDLAIGQLAALGSAVALLFFEGEYLYLTSLGFSLMGGLLIGLTSRKERNIEPLIGLMYAFGIAGVFLLLSKSPHGMEEIQNLMAYDVLFTTMPDIYKTTGIYAFLGILLFLIRNKEGLFKELAFFTIFAATVTSSVKLAGVLVVFALLIGPALIASYIPRGYPLINAWVLGTLINVGAIAGSFYLDFPTGYSIVFVQALVAMVVSAVCILIGLKLPDAHPHQPK